MRRRAQVMRSTTSTATRGPPASMQGMRWSDLVKRVYKVEKTLSPPKVTNLDAYLSEPAFRAIVPEVVWQKAEYIRQAGNVAVHGNKDACAGAGVERRAGAGARPLLGGSHLSAERGGEPSREDLRRVPCPHTWNRAPRRPASKNWTPSRANWTPPTTRARRSKASWRRCVNGSPPSRQRTRPSPRPVTGTRARPAG